MDDNEALEMMMRCREEIRLLRTFNADMAPKAEAWDRLGVIINLLPQRPQAMSEDLAWRLDKRIEELKAQMAASSKVPNVVEERG